MTNAEKMCGSCDCSDPTTMPELRAECSCGCHGRRGKTEMAAPAMPPTPWTVRRELGASVVYDANGGAITGPINGEAAHMFAASPEMFAALKEAEKIVKTARQYFPKSIRNSDRFSLELTAAAIGKALHKVGE